MAKRRPRLRQRPKQRQRQSKFKAKCIGRSVAKAPAAERPSRTLAAVIELKEHTGGINVAWNHLYVLCIFEYIYIGM